MAEPRRAGPKPIHQALLDNAPWKPVHYNIPIVAAIKALSRGEATPEQQRLALDWIIGWDRNSGRELLLTESPCGIYDDPFRPGKVDETHYALGRQFAGRQIRKLVNMNIKNLKE